MEVGCGVLTTHLQDDRIFTEIGVDGCVYPRGLPVLEIPVPQDVPPLLELRLSISPVDFIR